MEENEYGVYDVLLGIFNNLPKGVVKYNHDWTDFNKFFFDRRDKYSVLDKLAFDTEENFPESKELYSSMDTLDKSWISYYNGEDPFRNVLNRDAIKITFDRFSKKKFDEKELGELEILSEDFGEMFC